MEKIKQFVNSSNGKDVLIVIIIILVGLGSFELGRLSKSDKGSGVEIEYMGQEANAISAISTNENASKTAFDTGVNTNKNFFASSRGTKYYSIGCSAGNSIKQENRIYFNSNTEAERAGYELSGSCK